MKSTPQIDGQIRDAFSAMSDKYGLVNVLNIAKFHIYGSKTKSFEVKNLTYYADQRLAAKRYSEFQIPKKNGGVRKIHAPVPGLKSLLTCLNFVLQCVYENNIDAFATGFVSGKSVVDNARFHTRRSYVFNLDLKDFFPSIDLYRVKAVLGLAPFNLNDDREPIAYLIANLCCHTIEVERPDENNNFQTKCLPVLPQGAPTSPTLTNVICRRLDYLLRSVARRFDVTYSRYADDITFSGNKNIFHSNGDFITEVWRIIKDQRFVVNESKVRLQHKRGKQEVTGITVNEKINLSPKYVKEVRKWLYLWETYGNKKAEQIFSQDYQRNLGTIAKHIPPLSRVLEGKLLYMNMVMGKEHSTFQKLWYRFLALTDSEGKSMNPEAILSEKPQNNAVDSSTTISNSDTTSINMEESNPKTREGKITGNLMNSDELLPNYQEVSHPDNETKSPSSIIIKKIESHNPQNTSNFLAGLYDDPVIKAALHKWDGTEMRDVSPLLVNSFNHHEFIQQLRIRVNALKRQFPIQINLDTKVGYFFYDDKLYSTNNPTVKGWSEAQVTVSWNSEEVTKWCMENPGKWPAVNGDAIDYEGLVFNVEKKFGTKMYKSFSNIIQKFIHEIRFKQSEYLTNDVKSFFDRIFENKKYKLINEIESGLEFYADVEKFEQAMRKVQGLILEFIGRGDEIILKNSYNSSHNKIEIIHQNSHIDKTINSFHDHDGDAISNIRKLLTGVCDLHIEARFTNGRFLYPVLISNESQEVGSASQDINHVKYIFTFYKPN